jgi:hypothetical protein
LHEPVQPPLGLTDVLGRKKVLHEFDCVALSKSKVTRSRERTHGIVDA